MQTVIVAKSGALLDVHNENSNLFPKILPRSICSGINQKGKSKTLCTVLLSDAQEHGTIHGTIYIDFVVARIPK